jgi:hypothetical protein
MIHIIYNDLELISIGALPKAQLKFTTQSAKPVDKNHQGRHKIVNLSQPYRRSE